jgi:hypothetical protein
MFETPVLLIVFNRPVLAQKVFDQLRRIKPRYLFVAADGPRPGRPEDEQKCEATRAIFKQIDWPCDLKTLFSAENKGCGYGPAQAITWFFQHVEYGIILEDDCLPNLSFFPFCEQLLERYAHDKRVSMIGGTNPLLKWKGTNNAYIFSRMGSSWGWAGWRRAWQDFDYTAAKWFTDEGKKTVSQFLKNASYTEHFAQEFDHYFGEVRSDVWDFQWLFCRYFQGGCTILPTVNLITNIGFDTDATHTFDPGINVAYLAAESLEFPLKHSDFKIDAFFDWYVFERFISPKKRPLWKKVVLKAVKIATQNVK